MKVTFERATPEDAEALVKAQIAAFHYDEVLYPGVGVSGPPGYDSVDLALKRMQQDEFYKIVVDGQIVGGMILFSKGEGHWHLDLLNIVPEYQNRGIGKQAMQFIEQTYPATKWTLDTPGYAIRNQHFYEKCGYVKVAETEYPDITLISYEKRG
jgi:ribosomal protein S18 acetylase RimI-like enzyme